MEYKIENKNNDDVIKTSLLSYINSVSSTEYADGITVISEEFEKELYNSANSKLSDLYANLESIVYNSKNGKLSVSLMNKATKGKVSQKDGSIYIEASYLDNSSFNENYFASKDYLTNYTNKYTVSNNLNEIESNISLENEKCNKLVNVNSDYYLSINTNNPNSDINKVISMKNDINTKINSLDSKITEIKSKLSGYGDL